MKEIQLSEEQVRALREVYDGLVGDTIGVYQSIGNLTRELTKLKAHLKAGEYMEASHLGYTQISTEFIFLQRCLAGVQSGSLAKDKVTQEVAYEQQKAFEDVEPLVEAAWESLRKYV
jgi:hypothetical protein